MIRCVVLWVALVAALAACGSDNKKSTNAGTTPQDIGTTPDMQQSGDLSNAPLRLEMEAPDSVTEGQVIELIVSTTQVAQSVVDFELTVGGTATESDHDFAGQAGSIAVGESSTSFMIRVLDDLQVEPPKRLEISMTSDDAVVPETLVISIIDNDSASATLGFESTMGTTQEGDVFDAVLVLSEPTAVDVEFELLIFGGADWAIDLPTPYVIEAGQTRFVLPIEMVQDEILDPREITVRIESAPNAIIDRDAFELTITVLDDGDPKPTVNFWQTELTVREGALRDAPARVAASTAVGVLSEVPVAMSGTATQGTDFSWIGELFINPGRSLGDARNLQIINDSEAEYDETIILSIQDNELSAPGRQGTFVVTIIDDDGPVPSPTIWFERAQHRVMEGDRVISIPLRLNGAPLGGASIPYVVSGTATAADHNLVNGTLTVSESERTATLMISLSDNAVMDGARTIQIDLQAPVGAQLGGLSTSVVTIQDDDQPTVLFEAPGPGRFGNSLAATGDMNGDGIGDFAAADGLFSGVRAYSGADFSELFAVEGLRVSAAGDFNADGLADLAVYDTFRDANDSFVNRVDIYSGAGTILHTVMGTPGAGLTRHIAGDCAFQGAAPGNVIVAQPGYAVDDLKPGLLSIHNAGQDTPFSTIQGNRSEKLGTGFVECVGDLNGDGFEDLATGTEFNTIHSGLRVYSGATGNVPLFTSTAIQEWQEWFVVGSGDVNENGANDLGFLISQDRDNCSVGCVRHQVRDGSTLELLWDLPLEEAAEGSPFVRQPMTFADFDGDGVAELVLGDAQYSAGLEFRGKLYVFKPATGELLFVFEGSVQGEALSHVENLGDINGDGTDELLVGAPGTNLGPDGKIYVLTYPD